MALIRSKHSFDDHFTQIPNHWLRDDRLSLKAIGLLAQLMSHNPGWVMSIGSLATANKVGKDQIRSAIRELEEAGYLVRTQTRTETNQFAETEWRTFDPSEKPLSENPTSGNPVSGNPTTKNTIPKEEQVIEEQVKKYRDLDEISFEMFWTIYPRKTGKGAAKKAYLKAIKSGIPTSTLIDGVTRLAKDPNIPETQFIPHPATWLNEERWDDEPYAPRKTTATKQEKNAEAAAKFLEAFKTPTHEITENPDWA